MASDDTPENASDKTSAATPDDAGSKTAPRKKAQAYEALDSVAIATFDVDARIFRTLWHSFIRPADVAWASMTGDFSKYISPVRVFVALFSMQFIIGATVDLPMVANVDMLTTGYDPDLVTAWLGELNQTEVNLGLERVMSLLIWPIMIISSLPYLIALKFLRWRLKFWAHLMVYMIATNASSVMMILLIPTYALGPIFYSLSMPIFLFVFVMIMGVLMARFYARTVMGLISRIAVIVVLIPVSLLITVAGMFGSAAYFLHRDYDLSLLEFYEMAQESAPTWPPEAPATPDTDATSQPETQPQSQTDETDPLNESP